MKNLAISIVLTFSLFQNIFAANGDIYRFTDNTSDITIEMIADGGDLIVEECKNDLCTQLGIIPYKDLKKMKSRDTARDLIGKSISITATVVGSLSIAGTFGLILGEPEAPLFCEYPQ